MSAICHATNDIQAVEDLKPKTKTADPEAVMAAYRWVYDYVTCGLTAQDRDQLRKPYLLFNLRRRDFLYLFPLNKATDNAKAMRCI